jgi:hypothetical protein
VFPEIRSGSTSTGNAPTLRTPGTPVATDGLTEAHTTGPGRDRYGDEALLEFAAGLAPSTAAGAETP